MRERIILAPGASGNELIKSMALHGVSTINLRICSAGELARIALMRSGISVKEEFLSHSEECAEVAGVIKGIGYFKKPTYSDIREITEAIRRMRNLVTDTDEETQIETALKKGIFTEKNEALIQAYKNYMKALSDNGKIDASGLIRLAADTCREIDADFFILKEYAVSPLEKMLVSKLSGNKCSEISLQSLYGISDKPLKIESIRNCYGAPNEVETIISEIYKGKELDKCTIAVTDTATYAQLFFDYAILYDIPITFGCGLPIINTNPARLLVLYYRWMTSGFFSAGSLKDMLSSPAFDTSKLKDEMPDVDADFSYGIYNELLSGIRFTNDRSVNNTRLDNFKLALAEEEAITNVNNASAVYKLNQKKKCIPLLEVMASVLSLEPEEFIRKYAYIRKGNTTNSEKLIMGLDMAAERAIYDELSVIRNSNIEQTTEDLVKNILNMSICSQNTQPGKLHVTGIVKALSSVREHMYIAGLSADRYPGSPRESYLLLDDDVKQFGPQADYMSSKGRVKSKQDILMNLALISSALESKLYLSYSGLNVSELKRENASSMIFELAKIESGKPVNAEDLEAMTVRVEYFEPAVTKAREAGKAYVSGLEITPDKNKNTNAEYAVPWNLDKEYSPSELITFFDCPMLFMLTNNALLGIDEPEEDNPFETISAAAAGTLAHSLMERLANTTMSRNDFISLSGEYFDRFMKQNPSLISDDAVSEKRVFLDMMETAYDMDPHRTVILSEQDVHATHDCGVKLHGYPDRVERLEDGSYLVVDYKTGRNKTHVQDDIFTCLQIVIYAYLMEKEGYNVSGGEFRYIRLSETVSCKYDEDMKRELYDILEVFKKVMESGDFRGATEISADKCSNCKFKSVCGK